MKNYSSINEIKKDFFIKDEDLSTVRDVLNKMRAEVHPDTTKGIFEDKSQEEQYHNINSAIEYIDKLKNNQSLMVIEKMTDLMKIVADITPNNRQNNLENNLNNNISTAVSTHKSIWFLPKISLTAITTILTFIFFLPESISSSPILLKLVNISNEMLIRCWLVLLLITIFLWFIAYLNNEAAKKKLMLLKIDSTQNHLFNSFLSLQKNEIFTKDELTHFIYKWNKHEIENKYPLALMFGSDIITIGIAQDIAELVLLRAERNRVLQKAELNKLS